LDPDSTWQLIILAILIGSSGFFSSAETALMSLSKMKVRHMVDEKVKGAELVHKLVENPSKLLGAILVGNNIVNIGASALATSLAIKYWGNAGIGIATGIMTLLVLIFGEITPKSLAARNNEAVALKVAKPLLVITTLVNPIVIVLTFITNFIIRTFGGRIDNNQPCITEEELRTIVDVSHEEGILECEERQMIHNVFQFGDLQVKDVMTQRTDLISANINSSHEQILKILQVERVSRLPIFDENIDNIVGVLHMKDLFMLNDPKENFNVKQLMRLPLYTFEYKHISELFEEMQKKRVSMAIVLDEYGGTAGMITMEDLVEEIVGDLQDEHDEQELEIEQIKDNEYLVDGGAKIELVNELIGINIESEDFDSIGGFVIGELGRIPLKGEKIKYHNIELIVESLDRNRIDKLKVLLTNNEKAVV